MGHRRGHIDRKTARPRRRPAAFATALAVCLSLAGLFAAPASAEFHEQIAITAKAISLANTVTADPPGLMSIHYNPAGLTEMGDGLWVSQGLTVPIIEKTSKFTPDPNFPGFLGLSSLRDPLANTQGTSTSGRMYIPILDQTIDFLVSPALGVSYRAPGSPWTFAVGQYAPFAVGLVHGKADDPSRFGGQAVYQQHLVYLAPAVAYQFSDTLAFGLTVGMGQTAMGATLDMRSPNDLVGLTKILGDATQGLEIPVLSELTLPPPWFGGGIGPYDKVANFDMALRDDFTPNYNIGMLWKPLSWFSFGACYQSAATGNLTGKYKFTYMDNWQRLVHWLGSSPLLLDTSGMLDLPINSVPAQTGTVSATMTFPQRVQMGIKVKPFSRLSLLADLYWANWSVLKEDRFEFDQKIQLLQLVKIMGYTGGDSTLVVKRNFRDTWTWSVGAELELTDWLTLRCGYERRTSSVQTQLFDLLYALPDLDYYGAGLGIKLPNGVTLDLAAGYLVNPGYKIPDGGSNNLNYSKDFTKPVYNPYAGLNYEQVTKTYMGSFNVTMPWEVFLHPFGHKKKKPMPETPWQSQTPPESQTGQPSTLATPGPGAWQLNLASFSSQSRARMAARFYQDTGLLPQIEAKDGSWQLFIGPYADKQSAERAKAVFDLQEASAEPVEPTSIFLPPGTGFRLQLAAFDTRARAEMAARFYQGMGLFPQLRPESGRWVLETGRYASATEASQAAEALGLSEATVVSAAKAPAVPAPFTLKLAAFSSQARAQMAQRFYRSQGLETRLVSTNGSWQLFMGRYETRQGAEAAKTAAGLTEAEVVRAGK